LLKLNRTQREQIKARFAPVINDPVETAKRVLAWSLYFFGDPENPQHYYLRTQDIPRVHWGITLSLCLNLKFYYCTSPREFAKTSRIRIDTLYRIYYAMERYILIIGKIGDSGKSMLSDQKYDIEYNPKLLEVYGELKPQGRENVWSAHEIQLKNGVYMRSIGMLGNARGGLKRGWRYTFIGGDDVQDSMDMKEPSTLANHKQYWEREIEYALDSTYGKLRYIGNLLGKGCLLDLIMKDRKYKGTSFHALVNEDGTPDLLNDPKGRITSKSTWESKWPTEKLRQEAKDAVSKGKRAIFLAERQNVLVDELTKKLAGYRFHRMTFQRWHDVQNVLVGDDYVDPIPVYTYLAIDPAFSESKNADERALITYAKGRILVRLENVGEVQALNMTWILEYDYNFMNPTKIIDRALELNKKYFYRSVIIETIGGQAIYTPMTNEKIAGDPFYSMNPFTPTFVNYHRGDKRGRIYTTLQPLMSLGQIAIRPDMEEFINECEMFDSLDSPHLLDAFEFGNRVSQVCTEPLYVAMSKYDKRRIEREQDAQSNWRNWGVKNLKQLSVK